MLAAGGLGATESAGVWVLVASRVGSGPLLGGIDASWSEVAFPRNPPDTADPKSEAVWVQKDHRPVPKFVILAVLRPAPKADQWLCNHRSQHH